MDAWRQAVQYRNRAELLRTIAEDTPHAYHKDSLRRVAEYYDGQADLLEREAREQKAPAT